MSVVSLKQMVQSGIFPELYHAKNASWLHDAGGLRAFPGAGLKPVATLTQPFEDAYLTTTLGETKAWPFPQLFVAKGGTVLLFETSVYEVTENPSGWTAALLPAVHAGGLFNTLAPGVSIPPGGAWQFIDLWSGWMAFNGACMLLRFYNDANQVYVCEGTGGAVECLSNGDFASGTTDWTLAAGWSWGGGSVSYDGAHSGGYVEQNVLYFDAPIYGFVPHELTIVVSALSAEGTLRVYLGNTTYYDITATGTHTFRVSPVVASAGQIASVRFRPGTATDTVTVASISITQTTPTIMTGGNWNDGRAVLAGFNPADLYGLSDLQTTMAAYRTNIPDELSDRLAAFTPGAGGNWVWAGLAGGGDLPVFFNKEFSIYGNVDGSDGLGFDAAHPYLLHLLARREYQYLLMPWQGGIGAVRQLGTGMCVYGMTDPTTFKAGGVVVLSNRGEGRVGVDYVAGLPSGVGIGSPTAVAGDEQEHVFVNEFGEAWGVKGDMSAEKLGYKHLLEDMLDENLVVSFDPKEREYYLCSSYLGDGPICDRAYVLTRNGLSRAPWLPTTVSFSGGSTVGVVFEATDQDPYFLTGILAPKKGVGVLSWVRLVGRGAWQLRVWYRMRSTDDWTLSDTVAMDGRGIVQFALPGLEFKVEGIGATDASVEDLDVGFDETKPEWGSWRAAAAPGTGSE